MPFANICALQAVLRRQRLSGSAARGWEEARRGRGMLFWATTGRCTKISRAKRQHQDCPHQDNQVSRLLVVLWVSDCSSMGCNIDTQIRGEGRPAKTPAVSCKPSARFWGAIWGATADTNKSLIVDFDFDPAVFRASIGRVIWLNGA